MFVFLLSVFAKHEGCEYGALAGSSWKSQEWVPNTTFYQHEIYVNASFCPWKTLSNWMVKVEQRYTTTKHEIWVEGKKAKDNQVFSIKEGECIDVGAHIKKIGLDRFYKLYLQGLYTSYEERDSYICPPKATEPFTNTKRKAYNPLMMILSVIITRMIA